MSPKRPVACRNRSGKPSEIPESLRNLSYDQYRNIRFRKEQAIWNDEAPFEVELFHPGFLYENPVQIHLVEDGEAEALPFSPGMFSYENNVEPPDEESVSQINGFAGFRIHYPINNPDYKDEIAAFQGASYFRLIGRQQDYGLSARGLAIDTALPQGEEFPHFTEFWLIKPGPDATSMTLFALLESESITGAYRFRITPGHRTKVDVASRLFARNDIERLGIAPMTSMFLFGENSSNTSSYDDHRPEVHDSDSLLVEDSEGQWIRRPLLNRKSLHVSSLKLPSGAGFGLFQADRDFDHYRDLEANYEHRPSLWAQPQGDWGEGSIQLVEIPANKETHDNIVAFWTPEEPMEAGERRQYAYSMETMHDPARSHHLARATSTHTGWAAVAGADGPPPRTHRRFVVTGRPARIGIPESVRGGRSGNIVRRDLRGPGFPAPRWIPLAGIIPPRWPERPGCRHAAHTHAERYSDQRDMELCLVPREHQIG